jgi:glyoxylase-like metal-dependent hydrolase (beta-lactamase superfamily II)
MTIPVAIHCLPLPTPFPVGPVNVYLVEGDPLTLIDTGPKADLSRLALEAGLAKRGYRVEDLRRVIITHHHADHMGLAGEIVARSGAEVWTHPYNFGWLEDYTGQQHRNRPFYMRIWQEGGVPAGIIATVELASVGIAQWLDPVIAAHSLNEGDSIELGGSAWRVFHTPGHAGGLICLWDPTSRQLLANDHFIRDISSNPVLEPPPLMNAPRPRRLVEYLHHMRRMAALEPTVALPGHGEPVVDVAGLVRQREAFHARRADRILAHLDERPSTLWDLTQLIFPRLQRGMDYFLALSEVLGHLDLLEVEGRAHPQLQAGLLKWQKD